jgi:hypothetical protein
LKATSTLSSAEQDGELPPAEMVKTAELRYISHQSHKEQHMKSLILNLNVVVALLFAGAALAADETGSDTQAPAAAAAANAPALTDEDLAAPESRPGEMPAAEKEPAPAEEPAAAEEAPAPAEQPAMTEETPAPAEQPAMTEEAPAPAAPSMAPAPAMAATPPPVTAPMPATTSAAQARKPMPAMPTRKYDRQTILKLRDSKTLDLRYCLGLGDNVAIARCAGE